MTQITGSDEEEIMRDVIASSSAQVLDLQSFGFVGPLSLKLLKGCYGYYVT